MYKFLKDHKNLKNHELQGTISKIERVETRSILLKFYSNSERLPNNYCPAYQEHIDFKYFLREEMLEKDESEEKFIIVTKKICVVPSPLRKNFITFLRKFYLGKNEFKSSFKRLEKRFARIEKEFFYKRLVRTKKFFFNRNIKRIIFNLNYHSQVSKKIVYLFLESLLKNMFISQDSMGKNSKTNSFKNCNDKRFVNKNLKKKISKKKILLPISGITLKGLFYILPGLSFHIFTPFGFLRVNRKVFTLERLQAIFTEHWGKILPLKIHKIFQKNSEMCKIIARFHSVNKIKKFFFKKNFKSLKKKNFNSFKSVKIFKH